MQLSGAQKFVKWFVSKSRFEEMIKESKEWKFTCECGTTSSIWDAGGIRAGASGNPSKRLKCPACGKVAMRKVEKKY